MHLFGALCKNTQIRDEMLLETTSRSVEGEMTVRAAPMSGAISRRSPRANRMFARNARDGTPRLERGQRSLAAPLAGWQGGASRETDSARRERGAARMAQRL